MRSPRRGWLKNLHTEFEVIVNSSGTTVYTYVGTIQASDLQNITQVSIGAGQTATISSPRIVSQPNNFDPARMDQWWNTLPTSSSAPSSPSPSPSITPPVFTLSAGYTTLNPESLFTALQPFIIIVIVIIVIAVILRLVIGRKKHQLALPAQTAQPNK